MRGSRNCEPSVRPHLRPDEAEGGDDLVGIDFLAEAVGRFFFAGFSLTALLFTTSRAYGACGLLRIRVAYFRLYPVIHCISFSMAAFPFRSAF
jgi:hypothetical protein